MMTVSEQAAGVVALAERAQRGERDALEELCRRLLPTIEKWLGGMIRERHADVLRELTADIAQETWLQTQRKLAQFRGDTESALMAWCYRVTFATCKNYLKKYVRERHREEAVETLPEPESDPSLSAGENPRARLARAQKLDHARRAVMSLKNPRHREAIILFFFEDVPQREIARLMGASESAVSTWVYRGKKEIEKFLIETDFQQ